MPFGNPAGLYALLVLVPFILLYFFRPKTVSTTIPSLMFFMRQKGYSRRSNFFRNFLVNLLFLIQVFALGALAFSIAEPIVAVPRNITISDTAIVLDVSASMQAKLEGSTRFEQAVKYAKDNLNGEVSIVLAQSIPVTLLERGSRSKAFELLSVIRPRDTTTNIGDAMTLASDILRGKGRIIVLSDFAYSEGADPLVAKRLLSAKGYDVQLVDFSGKASNAGITDMLFDRFESRAFIKNFNDEERTVTLQLVSENKVLKEKALKIGKNSIESFNFETPKGKSELRIAEKDDLAADNTAYISSPGSEKIDVLLVTNADSSFIKTALSASPEINLVVAEPPVVPRVDYSVVVMNSITFSKLLPGFYERVEQAVSNGTGLVITAQDDLQAINDFSLMPVNVNSIGGSSLSNIRIENRLTKDTEFGVMSKYLGAVQTNNTLSLVEARDNSPLIALRDFNDGTVAYYGFFDGFSDFKNTPSYPIFWSNLVNFLAKSEDMADFNYKTGRIAAVAEQQVGTPEGMLKTSKVIVDKAGFYSFDGKTVAASLLNEKESDVSSDSGIVSKEDKEFLLAGEGAKRDLNLKGTLIVAGILLLLFELFYIKQRGDL